MMADLLCLDRGNTNLKGLLFDGDAVAARPDLLGDWRRALAELPLDSIDAALCSVAPSRDGELLAWLAEREIVPWILHGRSEVPFPVDLRHRETLGPDRLANMAAAWFARIFPSIVVDAGSAVTLDLMDRDGRYRGGLIIPGPRLWLDSLAAGGELLPAVSLDGEIPLPGRETSEAIAAGVVFGLTEAVEGLSRRLGDLIGGPVSVILTGGAATWLANHWRGDVPRIDSDWTLRGLRDIYRWDRAR